MVRKNGWQLPVHTSQVVAITVLCLLVVAFYVFFVPFIQGPLWRYILIGTYSPVALVVFILYVRCAAINPADPRIMSKFEDALKEPSGENNATLDIHTENSSEKSCCAFGAILCAVFVHRDCRKNYTFGDDRSDGGGQTFFCTECNAQVSTYSEHCTSCDKCVDGLTTTAGCIGYKNHATFIAFMASSFVWLVMESGVGIAVFVRYLVNKSSMEAEIIDRFGNGFPCAAFASVVGVCTVVCILVWVHLGGLLTCHTLAFRKGLTSNEYFEAMVAKREASARRANMMRSWGSG